MAGIETIGTLISGKVFLHMFSKQSVAESSRDKVLSSQLALLYDGKLNN